MTKTVKIKEQGSYNYEINNKMNGTTFVFSSESVANKSTINFDLPAGYYNDFNYCYRSGDDLFFIPIYSDGNDYNSVLIKIKDYYKYSSASKQDLVTYYGNYYGYSLYENAYDAWTYVKKTAEDSENGDDIFGDSGATTYNLSKTKNGITTIVDIGGKDKYKIYHINPTFSNGIHVREPFGNDNYEIIGSRGVNIKDFAGNEKYVVTNCTGIEDYSDFEIEDHSGNDNYQIDNVSTANINETFYIYDFSGNDVYNLKNAKRINIQNTEYKSKVKGNDKYTVKDSDNITITDNHGKDKYVMANITTALTISDGYYENDSYTISGAEKEVNVYDSGGKDTYKISNSNEVNLQDMYDNAKPVADSDKYTITNSTNVYIHDECGKDTYNISGSYNKKTRITTYTQNVTIDDLNNDLVINPELDNDKYNLTYVKNNSDNSINDYRGSNTYNIKNSEGINIISHAESGKDTYNITSSKNIIIADCGVMDKASDVYSVKLAQGGEVEISDYGGDKDKLTISNLNKKNLVFMSNYQRSTEKDATNSLILFDKTTKGYVQIDYMFEKSGNNYSTTEFGDGFIETVKAGKKTVDTTDADMINLLNSVRTVVAGWLNYHSSYSSVVDVLQNGTEADINGIIACFENNGVG